MMKRIFLLCNIFFMLLIAGCRKMDNLPQDAHYQPLHISWVENNRLHQYQVGQNALYSRSFVTTNSGGYRVFVYDFHITADSSIRIAIQSQEIIDDVESDLLSTLEEGRLIPFNTSDLQQPGKVIIEFLLGNQMYRTSNIVQNAENHIQIKKLKKVQISDKQFFEADIQFHCFVKNLSDETISELKNGRGQIAFRYR